jgi:hypothetical protein
MLKLTLFGVVLNCLKTETSGDYGQHDHNGCLYSYGAETFEEPWYTKW